MSELRLRSLNCAPLEKHTKKKQAKQEDAQPARAAVHWKANEFVPGIFCDLSAWLANIFEAPGIPKAQATTTKAMLSTGASA